MVVTLLGHPAIHSGLATVCRMSFFIGILSSDLISPCRRNTPVIYCVVSYFVPVQADSSFSPQIPSESNVHAVFER